MAGHLPPLQTLRAFEAAGRRLSMTLAAEELCVTHGAVSRQIKALEDDLGCRLFKRLTRKIEFTDDGANYFAAVTHLLSELARETENIRTRNTDAKLVINCSISFASKWLAQRLHRLMSCYPDYDIHLEVNENAVDFNVFSAHVVLRYGNGIYPNADSERIMDETVSPVCSPAYREKTGGIATASDLLSCKLIHENGMKTGWYRWFELFGVRGGNIRGAGYSHGSMSIEAAIRGEGVALGRSVLVAEDLASGRLVELFPAFRLNVEHGYDLIYAKGSRDHPKICAFRDWMNEEIRRFNMPE